MHLSCLIDDHPELCRGLEIAREYGVADLDGDGNEDVVLNTGGAVQGDKYDEALFHNPGGFGNHWLEVRLHGVKTNRMAIGAKITLTIDGSGTPSPAASYARATRPRSSASATRSYRS